MTTFIANPHALLTNGVVTDVVFMQEYDAKEIAETLKKYSYEEVVSCSEYGSLIYVGDVKIGSWIVSPAPHPLWTFDDVEGVWNPPSDWNESIEGWFPLCGSCSGSAEHISESHSNTFQYVSLLKKEKIDAN
jgi:hypothetical protein